MSAGGESPTVVLIADGVQITVAHLEGVSVSLALVDILARLQLAARRRGWSIVLRNPSVELRELIDLVGLADVIPTVWESALQPGGQAEGGEELGVQEIVPPRDPPA